MGYCSSKVLVASALVSKIGFQDVGVVRKSSQMVQESEDGNCCLSRVPYRHFGEW